MAEAFSLIRLSRHRWTLIAVVAVIAVALRINAGLGRDLWEDEIISSMHAARTAWIMPVQVMRNDVHPFLYFFQLHFWSLIGDSDLVLRLNSSFWSILALLSFPIVLHRLYGRTTGLIGFVFLAVSAPMVWMSQDLRPYSWMNFLYIWAFYFVERCSRSSFGTRTDTLLAGLLCVMLAYSHSLGVLIVFLLGCYCLTQILHRGMGRAALLTWLLLFGGCALLALPPITNDLFRDANLEQGATVLDAMFHWPAGLLLPRSIHPGLTVLAFIVYAATGMLGFRDPRTRALTVVFIIGPILLALICGRLGIVIYKQNIFSLITNLFIILVAARLLSFQAPELRVWGTGVIGAVFFVFCLSFFLDRVATTGFKEAASYIGENLQPGDVIFVPQESMYFGIARYLGLEHEAIAARAGLETTSRWQGIYNRLGGRFVSVFQLEPKTQSIRSGENITLLMGHDPTGIAPKARRVWLVTYPRNDLPAGYPPNTFGALRIGSVSTINFLQVRLYQ